MLEADENHIQHARTRQRYPYRLHNNFHRLRACLPYYDIALKVARERKSEVS